MKTKGILLIGGGGFIGSNLAKYFSEHGEKVIVADRSCKIICKNVSYENFDFYSNEPFERLLKNVSKVFLLSCNITPNKIITDCYFEYCQNITRLVSLLEAMRKNSVNSLYFTSSGGTIYGSGFNSPISEKSITNPINYYGIMKLTQEKIICLYNKNYGMQNVIFRISNPYGIGQNLKNGVGVVTAFISNLLCNKSITIYGDGSKIVRDYIYIDDLCKCIYMLLKTQFVKTNCVFNIGTGIGYSLVEVLKIIENVLQIKANVRILPPRCVDVEYNVLDNTLLKKTIGIESFTSLEFGIKQYCKYIRNNR